MDMTKSFSKLRLVSFYEEFRKVRFCMYGRLTFFLMSEWFSSVILNLYKINYLIGEIE